MDGLDAFWEHSVGVVIITAYTKGATTAITSPQLLFSSLTIPNHLTLA